MQTISGKEEFFKKDGYLAVHFDITIKGDDGTWYKFSNWENTGFPDSGLADVTLYESGDVIWYNLSKKAGDDYEVGGVE